MSRNEQVLCIQNFWRQYRYLKKTSRPTLTEIDITRAGPHGTHSWSKKPLELTPKTRKKYNSATCTQVSLNHNRRAIADLIAYYHEVCGLPGFLQRFLEGGASKNRLLQYYAPSAYMLLGGVSSTNQNYTMIKPNPEYIDAAEFTKKCLHDGSEVKVMRTLKDSPQGLSLIAWTIHPSTLPQSIKESSNPNRAWKEVLSNRIEFDNTFCVEEGATFDDILRKAGGVMSRIKRSMSNRKLPRSPYQDSISSIEESSGIPYLACIFDFDRDPAASIEYLRWQRAIILEQLKSHYGVTQEDKIKIYFHIPYLESTTTVHTHIRVNQADHALEDSKSVCINDIIRALECGSSVQELVLSREHICCSSYPVGKLIAGVDVEFVPNRLRDWSDIINSLNTSVDVQAYLVEMLQYEDVLSRFNLLDLEEIYELNAHLLTLGSLPPRPDLIAYICANLKINHQLEEHGWSLQSGLQVTEEAMACRPMSR